jgi:hypothetical protein
MATRKSINIWIIIGILTIAAWLLGFVTSAGAQTYTVKCRSAGYFPKMHIIEVGDVPAHILLLAESAAVLSCDDGRVATGFSKNMAEFTKGSGKSHQWYEVFTFEEGSTYWIKAQFNIRPAADGKTGIWEGTFEYVKGTGRFEGIKGGGTYTGKRFAPVPGGGSQFYVDYTGTYTLPSK